MTPLKWLRKFGKLIRGGAGSWHIVLGCVLGTLIGMTPGFNMTVLLTVLVLVLLSANMGMAVVGFLVGKALCVVLAPVTFHIGFFLIHQAGLTGLFRAASDTPVVALMNLHYYCLVGGLPIAIVVGAVMGLLFARAVRLIRAGLIVATDKSAKVQRLANNAFVRFLMWLIFGKRKRSLKEALTIRQPILRKSGILVCGVFALLLVGFEVLFLDRLVRSGLIGGLEAAVGAEVNIENVDFSLLQGRMKIEGLQVTDPDKPTHNMIQAKTLNCDISIVAVLTKRFVIDELVISGMRTDAKRVSEGEVYKKPDVPEPEFADDVIYKYIEKGRKAYEYVRKLRQYLDAREKAKQEAEEGVDKDEVLSGKYAYLKLSARSTLVKRPTVTIRHLRVDDLAIGEGVGKGVYALEGEQLSDKPELNDEPMSLRLTDKEGLKAGMTLDFISGDRWPVALTVKTPHRPISELVRASASMPIDFSEAKASLSVAGKFNSKTFKDEPGDKFLVEINVKDMALPAGLGGAGIPGFAASDVRDISESLSEAYLVLALHGSVLVPRVRVEKSSLDDIRGKLADLGGKLKDIAIREGLDLAAEKLGGVDLRGLLDRLRGGSGNGDTPETRPGILPGILPGLPRLPGLP